MDQLAESFHGFGTQLSSLLKENSQNEAARAALDALEGQVRAVLAAEQHAAQEQVSAILGRITECYFKVDREFRFVEFNRQALDYLDRRAEDLLGQMMWDVYPELRGSELEANCHKALDEHQVLHFEMQSVSVPRWAEVHLYPNTVGLAVYFADITQRKQTERALVESNRALALVNNALSESHQQLENVLGSITEAYFSLDRKWRIVAFNQVALHEFLLRKPEELLGKVFWDLFPQSVGNDYWRNYHTAFETDQPVHFEALSGLVPIWYEVHAYPSAEGLDIYLHNINDRKAAEQEQERLMTVVQEERDRANQRAEELEAIINSMTDMVILYNTGGQISTRCNPAALGYYGMDLTDDSREEFLTRVHLFHPDGSPLLPEEYPSSRAMRREVVKNERILAVNDRGEASVQLVSASPVLVAERMTGVVVVARDLTEQEQMEIALRERTTQLEVQRLLMNQREMERQQIARDLHDGPLQDLIAINYNLSEALDITDKEGRLTRMQALREILNRVIQETRSFCYELRPPVLVPFGLERAIRSHSDTFRRKYPQLKVALELSPDGQSLPEEMRLALFRIYQELINNVARHAQATQAVVHFHLDAHEVVLEVVDNGAGFTMPEEWISLARQGHLGLVGVRERAEAIGGMLEVRSQLASGTRARVRVPRTAV